MTDAEREASGGSVVLEDVPRRLARRSQTYLGLTRTPYDVVRGLAQRELARACDQFEIRRLLGWDGTDVQYHGVRIEITIRPMREVGS